MIYVALLRGINVGVNNRVDMKQLIVVFERAGMSSVSTYINSGNVVFQDDSHSPQELVELLETAIESAFGFKVQVLLRDMDTMKTVVAALQADWKNDATMKCDVVFLWDAIDSPTIIHQLALKPDIDDVRYVPGALISCISRENVSKSGMLKLVGSPLYKQLTIRNCNTVRKLLEVMTAKLSE